MPALQKIKMYYDPLGRVIKTVNPDKTEQRVIYGIPDALNTPNNFAPTPWENFAYDANDLAPVTTPTGSNVPNTHFFTPKSSEIDALGRIAKTIEYFDNGGGTYVYGDIIEMNYRHDIRGNLLLVKDPYNRDVFTHVYDLQTPQKDQPPPPLKTVHIDKGLSNVLYDATGKSIESHDAKGALGLSAYDSLQRPKYLWAKNKTGDGVTLRNYISYGDSAMLINPQNNNLKGQLYHCYDEAGLIEIPDYDFKGNVLTKNRQVISSTTLKAKLDVYNTFIVDWTGLPASVPAILDSFVFTTDMEYDALNRITKLTLPEDVNTNRKDIFPAYNTAGALEKVSYDGTVYVENIAYNAKGQRLLIAFGNDVMTRYAYDPITFRLLRERSEKYTKTQVGSTITYAYNSGTTRQDDGFNFDLVGNIIKILNRISDCGISTGTLGSDALDREFDYDSIYRLTYANGRESNTQSGNSYLYDDAPAPGSPNANNVRFYSRTYDYDKLGNLQNVIQAGVNGFTRHFVYNTGINTLQKIEDATPTLIENFTYDIAGNQITSGSTRNYKWNHADQLICYYNQIGTSDPTVYTQYDYSGQNRISKLVRTGTASTPIYERTIYIDGIFEYCILENGTTYEKNYVHVMDDKSRIAEVRVGTAFPGDIADSVTYNLEDQIGSSVMRLNTTGSEIDKEEYYPFGDSSLRTFSSKRYRYVGKEKDQESGLYYYGARYYSAWTCRFISVDPLASKYVHQSSYVHADDNPINKIDHNGEGTEGGGGGDKGGGDGNKGGETKEGSTEPPKPEVHNVKKGETLSGIAKEHGTTVEKLREANNLDSKNDRKLQIGTKLSIPGKTTSTTDNKVAPLINSEISINKLDALKVVPKTQSGKGGVDEGLGPMIHVPAVGPALQSGIHLEKGEYLQASIWFVYALADVFTLGSASKAKLGTVLAADVIEEALPRTEPIISSIGAASRAEKLAMKLKMNMSSPTTKQVLNSLDDTVESFIANFRKASIYSEFPGGQGGNFAKMTVEEALRTGNTTVKKLLVDTRFIKR